MDLHQYVYDDRSAVFGTSYSDVYDQSIHWTDRLIGLFLTKLDERGLLERTIVVIASDHGEAFREHGSEGHARNLYGEVTHVPLIISLPFLLEPGIRVRADGLERRHLADAARPARPAAAARRRRRVAGAAGARGRRDSSRAVRPSERPIFAQLARGWGNPKVGRGVARRGHVARTGA